MTFWEPKILTHATVSDVEIAEDRRFANTTENALSVKNVEEQASARTIVCAVFVKNVEAPASANTIVAAAGVVIVEALRCVLEHGIQSTAA